MTSKLHRHKENFPCNDKILERKLNFFMRTGSENPYFKIFKQSLVFCKAAV